MAARRSIRPVTGRPRRTTAQRINKWRYSADVPGCWVGRKVVEQHVRTDEKWQIVALTHICPREQADDTHQDGETYSNKKHLKVPG